MPSPAPTASAAASVQPPAKTASRRSERPLRLGQQVVAPVERRPQRLLARQRRPAAAGQQPEAVVQPRGDLLDRQRPHPRRRQLERQRDAVQPPADRGHRRRVRRRSSANPAGRAGRPLDEEPPLGRRPRRRTVGRPARGRSGRPARARARPSRRRCASGSRLVARRRRSRAGAQQRLGQPRARVDQVLAVVQHQQQAPWRPARRPASRSAAGPAARATPSAPRDRRRHERRVGQRRQLDQPDAVRVVGPAPPAPTSSARRVLPTPPAPVSVSSRVVARSRAAPRPARARAADEAGQRRRQVGRPRGGAATAAAGDAAGGARVGRYRAGVPASAATASAAR